MNILLIDNYDSFTYNIKQEVEILGHECQVHRNDEITLEEIERLRPAGIIISPGPGRPESAGIIVELLTQARGEVPILGVCLGHQAIGLAMGARVVRAKRLRHGKVSVISHDGKGVFSGLEGSIQVARYHSLVLEKNSLPDTLEVTAMSEDGEIMGVRNVERRLEGVQFHPESIATRDGRRMMKNYLEALIPREERS